MPCQRDNGKIKMNVLGISGTPRKGGLTDNLLDKALEGARSAGGTTEKIVLNDMNFKPCQECGDMTETGACSIRDDMQGIYKKCELADAFIVASPVYFGTVSAQLKMMIDRFQAVWVRKYVLKSKPSYSKRRKGIFLCVGGMDTQEYFKNSKTVIKIWFATLDIDYFGDLFFGGCNTKADKKEEKDRALNNAFELGKSLVSAF